VPNQTTIQRSGLRSAETSLIKTAMGT